MRRPNNRKYRRARNVHRQPSIYNRTSDMEKKKGVAWGLIFFLILLFGTTYLVFFSPVLMINNFKISDTKFIEKNAVESEAKVFTNGFLNKNIISINTSGLAKKIKSSSSVKEVKVVRKFPNTIFIEIEERRPVFIIEYSSKRYLIDEYGYAFLLNDEKYDNIFLIKDNRNLEVKDNTKAFHSNLIDLIDSISTDFERLSGTKVKSIELVNTIDEIKVVTEANWYVYFNPEYNPGNQLINLSRVIQDAKNKNIKIEYVDLRAENKIFYK